MDKNLIADVGLDAAKWIGEKAQSHIDRVNRSVRDAYIRSEGLNKRTSGTTFDAYGRERQRIANELIDNPPNKLANAVKLGVLLVSGALLVYKAFNRQ